MNGSRETDCLCTFLLCAFFCKIIVIDLKYLQLYLKWWVVFVLWHISEPADTVIWNMCACWWCWWYCNLCVGINKIMFNVGGGGWVGWIFGSINWTHEKSMITHTIGDIINRMVHILLKNCALLENSAVRGMVEFSTRLNHRDWPVINILNGCQMGTNGNIWRFSISLSLSLRLSPFSLLCPFCVRQLFQASTRPYSCTSLNWLTRHRLETPKYRTTGRYCPKEIACVVCLCPFETDKG